MVRTTHIRAFTTPPQRQRNSNTHTVGRAPVTMEEAKTAGGHSMQRQVTMHWNRSADLLDACLNAGPVLISGACDTQHAGIEAQCLLRFMGITAWVLLRSCKNTCFICSVKTLLKFDIQRRPACHLLTAAPPDGTPFSCPLDALYICSRPTRPPPLQPPTMPCCQACCWTHPPLAPWLLTAPSSCHVTGQPPSSLWCQTSRPLQRTPPHLPTHPHTSQTSPSTPIPA